MTTTSTFQGLDPEARKSSRVLRPPGGGSSFSFGVEKSQQQQPARRHKMASDIFGIQDNDPAPVPCVPEPEPPESAACGDDPYTCVPAEYSDAAEHTGEAEVPEMELKKVCVCVIYIFLLTQLSDFRPLS
ncbi:jupiter microtubule associated homolog 1 isoform X2 [Engystomops pustulosus]|uniref:jupiter microtubule associated homolog 1 isoform X2 n=1 Tax=Engystomops pustulosus TaxID=76066 RepID=UPI003AFA591C